MKTNNTKTNRKNEIKNGIKANTAKEEYIIKDTWGSMSSGKKLEYLWMYYKGYLFGAVILILLICVGVSSYKNAHTKVLLNAVIIGGDNLKTEWLEESFSEYAGIKKEDGILRIRTSIPDDGGGMTSTTTLTTLMGADAVDILVCPKNIYDDYAACDGFLDMEELLGGKSAEFGGSVLDTGIHLTSGNIFETEQMTSYNDIYAAIPVNCQNREMAVQFLEYLMQ